ncbi:N-6 DNA methylase, partial [bacterium]|nr:N-6 DNA methylase [bacterium]
DILSQLRDHWHYILDEINYHPIFFTARQILGCFSADARIERAIKELIRAALKIVSCRAALRHDLAGRIYHRLLEEAKYLGAYYTSVPAAVILLKLALSRTSFSYNWASQDELQSFHIADLACGTGTLLMAATDAVVDNYIRDCNAAGDTPDLTGLHQRLVAHTIYGYDVLASAVHLTASTLSLRVPETPINITHLYKMPLGSTSQSLGSLEFLDSNNIQATLFSAPEQVTGPGPVEVSTASIPRLDLCVMNPPFTRSVGGNLLFGNFPDQERRGMQNRLRRIVSSHGISASITAGLGAPFVALADEYIKPRGSLALVLPRTLLSGVAWEKTRRLIENTYYVEYIVVSHQPGHWNFSENTSLSETLIVARKRDSNRTDNESLRTVFVNLWQQPKTSIEALSIVSSILYEHEIPSLEEQDSFHELELAGQKSGEVYSVAWNDVKGNWSFSCSYAQGDLNKALHHMLK